MSEAGEWDMLQCKARTAKHSGQFKNQGDQERPCAETPGTN